MAAEQAEREGDAIADHRVFAAQEIDGLDEARDADDGIAPRDSTHLADDAGELDRVITRLAGETDVLLVAGDPVAEQPVAIRRSRLGHMHDRIDQAGAEQLARGPCRHPAGAAARPEIAFRRVP